MPSSSALVSCRATVLTLQVRIVGRDVRGADRARPAVTGERDRQRLVTRFSRSHPAPRTRPSPVDRSLGPQVATRRPVRRAARPPEPVAGALHAALEQGAHAELLADGARIHAWPLYENEETLPLTMSFGTWASMVIRVSAMAVRENAFAGSDDRLENGSTARRGRALRMDDAAAGVGADFSASLAVDSVRSAGTPHSPAPPTSSSSARSQSRRGRVSGARGHRGTRRGSGDGETEREDEG